MHLADVVLRVGITEHIGNLAAEEHVVGVLAVDVAGEGQPAREHAQVDTHIPGLGGLPGYVVDSICSLGGRHY